MDTSAPVPATPSVLDTLRTVEFRLGLKGYNVDEVDEYLEKAAVEATTLKEQLRQLTDRLKQATERIAQLEQGGAKEPAAAAVEPAAPAPAPAPVPASPPASPASPASSVVADDTLQQTLLMAQRFVEQAKRESESEAASLVARAEDRAQAIVNQAEDHARQLAMDAEQRLREEVHRLESARSQLASDVESLTRYLDTERTRLHGTLSDMGKWLDEKLQPAAALAALRSRPVGGGDRPEIGTGGARPPARPAVSSGRPPASPRGSNGGAAPLDSRPGGGAGRDGATEMLDLSSGLGSGEAPGTGRPGSA